MALNLPDFLNARPIQPDNSALANIFGNYNKGYEVAQMPAQKELERSLMQAQTQKAQQAELHPMARAIKNYQEMKQIAPDAPETKLFEQWLEKETMAPNGMSLSIDPETGAVQFSQGGSSKGGSPTALVDGKLLSKPSAPTTNEQQSTQLANVAREEVAKFEQPYVGTGSNLKLINDRLKYENTKDPEEKKRIFDNLARAAAAAMIAPEYAAIQLQAQGVRATVSSLNHQLHAIKQGWPEGLDAVINNLPPEVQEEAKRIHSEKLKEVTQKRSEHFAKGLPIDLNKEEKDLEGDFSKTLQGETSNLTTMQKNGQDINKKLTPIKLNGKKYNIPLNRVEEFMNENPGAHREQ